MHKKHRHTETERERNTNIHPKPIKTKLKTIIVEQKTSKIKINKVAKQCIIIQNISKSTTKFMLCKKFSVLGFQLPVTETP